MSQESFILRVGYSVPCKYANLVMPCNHAITKTMVTNTHLKKKKEKNPSTTNNSVYQYR